MLFCYIAHLLSFGGIPSRFFTLGKTLLESRKREGEWGKRSRGIEDQSYIA